MITFVMTEEHQYTLRAALESGALRRDMILLSYADFLSFPRLPVADYVFVDLERLSDADIARSAARLAALRALAPGIRVLNAPEARLGRLAVMRGLHAAGINDFRVVMATELPADLRYPVFLRRMDDHDGPMTGLLADAAALGAALADLAGRGLAADALAVTEYVDARNAEGLHVKLSYFRIGDRLFPSAYDLSRDWVCKGLVEDANSVLAPEAERRFLTENPHADLLRPAFDAVGIGYGRADYVVVDGCPRIFEINTNPFLDPPDILPGSLRDYSERLLANWTAAMAAFSPVVPGETPAWIPVPGASGVAVSGHRMRRAFRHLLIGMGQLHRETALMRPARAPARMARRIRDRLRPGAGHG